MRIIFFFFCTFNNFLLKNAKIKTVENETEFMVFFCSFFFPPKFVIFIITYNLYKKNISSRVSGCEISSGGGRGVKKYFARRDSCSFCVKLLIFLKYVCGNFGVILIEIFVLLKKAFWWEFWENVEIIMWANRVLLKKFYEVIIWKNFDKFWSIFRKFWRNSWGSFKGIFRNFSLKF